MQREEADGVIGAGSKKKDMIYKLCGDGCKLFGVGCGLEGASKVDGWNADKMAGGSCDSTSHGDI